MIQYQYGGPEVKEASLKRIIISEAQHVLEYINNTYENSELLLVHYIHVYTHNIFTLVDFWNCSIQLMNLLLTSVNRGSLLSLSTLTAPSSSLYVVYSVHCY